MVQSRCKIKLWISSFICVICNRMFCSLSTWQIPYSLIARLDYRLNLLCMFVRLGHAKYVRIFCFCGWPQKTRGRDAEPITVSCKAGRAWLMLMEPFRVTIIHVNDCKMFPLNVFICPRADERWYASRVPMYTAQLEGITPNNRLHAMSHILPVSPAIHSALCGRMHYVEQWDNTMLL